MTGVLFHWLRPDGKTHCYKGRARSYHPKGGLAPLENLGGSVNPHAVAIHKKACPACIRLLKDVLPNPWTPSECI